MTAGAPDAAAPRGRFGAVVLVAVIVLTAAAFAGAQRIKRADPIIDPREVQRLELFSPKLQTWPREARFSFKLSESDVVTMTIVTRAGDEIRRIATDVRAPVGKRIRGRWDGAKDNGQLAPDGEYRVKVALRERGRALLLPNVNLVLDTTPPQPKLLSVGPEQTGTTPRPELFPRADGKPVRARFRVSGRKRAVTVWRTDLARPRLVLQEPVPEGESTWEWDGTANGSRVPQGTYVIAVRASDLVGNVGWSTGSADQIAPFGGRLKGQGGVMVRYLAAQVPEAPVAAGERAEFGVISPRGGYDWSIRRIGESRSRSRGSSERPILRPKLPSGPSGLHVLRLRRAGRTVETTILTNGRKAQKVLVVVPQATLIGGALVDDNGDGAPDTLLRGQDIPTGRVPVSPDLPADMRERIAPLLLALDRRDRRYALTTDLALARGTGPKLSDYEGVVLAGTHLFSDGELQRSLVSWVKRGGRLWIAEPESLRRTVTVTENAAVKPTQPASTDPFGFELGPLQQVSSVIQSRDRAGLLKGTDGKLDGPLTVEPIVRAPTGATLLTEATTAGGGQSVLAAVQVDRGVVIRSGVSGLGASALRDADAREFLRQTWSYLRNG